MKPDRPPAKGTHHDRVRRSDVFNCSEDTARYAIEDASRSMPPSQARAFAAVVEDLMERKAKNGHGKVWQILAPLLVAAVTAGAGAVVAVEVTKAQLSDAREDISQNYVRIENAREQADALDRQLTRVATQREGDERRWGEVNARLGKIEEQQTEILRAVTRRR